MNLSNAKKQTLQLTCVNGFVRALGLVMRIFLSRLLGAEIMGIMELAQSVHMAAISPVTSGLPAAISRMTAKADCTNRLNPLAAGLFLVRLASWILIPALWFLSPVLARMMGDVRVLPSLWFTAPCILVLGYSGAINGYCYGMGKSLIPAKSELIEQVARFALTLSLLWLLHGLTSAWIAAVPVFATLLAELFGMIYAYRALKVDELSLAESASYRMPVFRLAYPVTLSRILQTILRSLTAILIPLRLQASGLSAAESTAQLGMLNGMIMPFLLLPCIFTNALSMVALPRFAKAEEQPSELRRLMLVCLGSCIPFSILCAIVLWLGAPFLANRIYRLAELTVLFRLCVPMTLLNSLVHLTGTVLSALGQQRRALQASCITSAVSALLTWLLAANPALRMTGVIYAQFISQALSIISGGLILWLQYRHSHRHGGKSS